MRASFSAYLLINRLKQFVQSIGDERNLFITDEFIRSVEKAVYDIYRYPLRQLAVDTLNRQLRGGISDENLAHLLDCKSDHPPPYGHAAMQLVESSLNDQKKCRNHG